MSRLTAFVTFSAALMAYFSALTLGYWNHSDRLAEAAMTQYVTDKVVAAVDKRVWDAELLLIKYLKLDIQSGTSPSPAPSVSPDIKPVHSHKKEQN